MSRRQLAGASAAVLLAGLAFAPGGNTFAAFSDYGTVNGNGASAAVWQPNPPAACFRDGATYTKVVYLTDGNDTYDAGNRGEIVMGLGGNDIIKGGNGKDCLVGGDGNDTLYGDNGKDILLGGRGDDTIYGDNGKEYIDGGDGADACDGGNAPDVVNCESAAEPPLGRALVPAPPDGSTSAGVTGQDGSQQTTPPTTTSATTPQGPHTTTPTPNDPTTVNAAPSVNAAPTTDSAPTLGAGSEPTGTPTPTRVSDEAAP